MRCGRQCHTDSQAMSKIKKYFAKHSDYFKNFEKVVLMFDSDIQGRSSAEAAATVLGARAAIAELPLHDAADCLKEGKTAELIDAMWKAVPYRPAGIVELSTLRDKAMGGVVW